MSLEGSNKAVKAAGRLRKRWAAGMRPAGSLFDLAGEHGVLVFRLALDANLSGAFLRSQRHKTDIIVINTSRKNLYHQRFSLAHELGHLELHADQGALVEMDDEGPDSPRNHEANVFAAELLVPLSALQAVLRSYRVDAPKISDGLVIELARMFGVSHEVILWRLKVLGNLPRSDVKHRIDTTDWDAKWRLYAPDAHKNTVCGTREVTWGGQGVSAEIAEQVSRLPTVYREMAFEAYRRREITAVKLAEVLGLENKQAALHELVPLIDPAQSQRDQELAGAMQRISEHRGD